MVIGKITKSSEQVKSMLSSSKSILSTNTTTKTRQSGWVPLAYPPSAFQNSASGIHHQCFNSTGTNHPHFDHDDGNPYFPLEKNVLSVLIRDLLVIDGVIDPKTYELIKVTQKLKHYKYGSGGDMGEEDEPPYLRHWDPDWMRPRNDHERDNNTCTNAKSTTSTAEREWKRKLEEDDCSQHTSISTVPSSSRRWKGKKGKGKRMRVHEGRNHIIHTTLGECERSIHFISKHKKIKIKVEKKEKDDCSQMTNANHHKHNTTPPSAVTVSTPFSHGGVVEKVVSGSTISLSPHDVRSCDRSRMPPDLNAPVIIIEDSDAENDNTPSCAEQLVAEIMRRAISKDQEIPTTKHGSSSEDIVALPSHIHSQRSRFVSDADLLGSSSDRSSGSSRTAIAAAARTKMVVALNNGTPHSVSTNKIQSQPQLVRVSIFHEEYLRKTAKVQTNRVLESFSTYAIRKLLSYRSNSISRDKMIQILSNLLFDVSHAIYAWQQTERDILMEQPQQISSRTLLCNDLDKQIVELLLDKRDLNRIGGFDSYSILPNALLIHRLAERQISWSQFAKTGVGRKALMERGGGGSYYRVSAGWVGIWRKTKNDNNNVIKRGDKLKECNECNPADSNQPNPVNSPSKNESNADDGESIQPPLNKTKDKDTMPCLVPLKLYRKKGDLSWGIKLAREGEMCVVMKIKKENGNHNCKLKEGDIIVQVNDELGECLSAPYYDSKLNFYDVRDPFHPYSVDEQQLNFEEDPDRRRWFKKVVDIFKSSDVIDLKVTRAGS